VCVCVCVYRPQSVYSLARGNFIGEMGLHVGMHITAPLISSATVTVTQPMRCLVWNRKHLIDLLEQHPALQHSIQAAITADLVRKLKATDQSSSSSSLTEKALVEYNNLMKYDGCSVLAQCTHIHTHTHTRAQTHTHTRTKWEQW
jgi:CRP-like cAMP-binding protein